MENSKVVRTILLNDFKLSQKDLLINSFNANVVSDDDSVEIRGREIVFTCNSFKCPRIEEKILSIVSKLEINPEAVWAFLGDCGYYTPFPEQVNSEIENYYIEVAKVIDPCYESFSSKLLVDRETNSIIEFDKLGGFHIMLKNNEILPIKRFANHEKFSFETTEVMWQWKNDQNNFIYYEDDINYLIETSYKRWQSDPSKKHLYIPSHTGNRYKINLETKEQISLMYQSKRKIRRQV